MTVNTTELHGFAGDVRQGGAASKIIEAAIHEFDEAGYDATSVNDIAKRAGTSKSLVSYHFPTKVGLAATVVNLGYPSGVFMGMVRRSEDPLTALEDAVAHVAGCVAHDQLARVTLHLRRHREVRKLGAHSTYSGWLVRITDLLEEARQAEIIPGDTDVPTEARLVVAGVGGLLQMALESGDYLALVHDAVHLTRDRIDSLTHKAGN